MKFILTLCLVATFFAGGKSALFCEVRWPNCNLLTKNIVCERDEKCLPEPGCENVESDSEFLKWILHEHNRLRNEIATGKDSRGYTGPASNMMALSYDKDLEFSATCNANRCKFEHDKCRGTTKFLSAGQNLFYATGNVSELKGAVTAWFEEIKDSTPDVIDKFPREVEKISRFAQMIWASTTHMGCARAKKSGTDEYFLACNYGPGGNQDNKRIYKRGEACSQCPFMTKCNEQYPGLCGKIDQDTIGPGTGGSGLIAGEQKEQFSTEKPGDKVVAGGGAGGAPGAPGLGGFGGLGGLGGLGLPGSGPQNEKDKQDDNKEKKKTTTQSTGRHDIGHFTQLIWAKTTHIGCAAAKGKSPDGDEFYLACNYGTMGNMIGKTVYERGPPCTKCPPNSKCNPRYPGLCGDIDETQIKSGPKAPNSDTSVIPEINASNQSISNNATIHSNVTNVTTPVPKTTPGSGNIYFISEFFIFSAIFMVIFW